MTKTRILVTTTSVCVLVAMLHTAVSDTCEAQAPQPRRHADIMERKLDSSQKVMEGIARADFDLISKEAQKLHLLSREAGWNVLLTPTYMQMSEDFRATARQLERSAESKNLDSVGLAYIKLSISCIECHRYAKKEMPRIGQVIPKPKNSVEYPHRVAESRANAPHAEWTR